MLTRLKPHLAMRLVGYANVTGLPDLLARYRRIAKATIQRRMEGLDIENSSKTMPRTLTI